MIPVLYDSSCTETILICCETSSVNLYLYPTCGRVLSYQGQAKVKDKFQVTFLNLFTVLFHKNFPSSIRILNYVLMSKRNYSSRNTMSKERRIIWARFPAFFDRTYPRHIPMVTSKESYRYITSITYSVKRSPLL